MFSTSILGLKQMSYPFNRQPLRNLLRPALGAGLTVFLVINLVAPASACGPSFIQPIFVFKTSPDLPFTEFTSGRIGIVQPTFGRKTLTIAFRYLNGGSFTTDEQKALIAALRGNAETEETDDPVKTWVATRKELVTEKDQLPAIYVERRYGGYDFFPNCAPNAFEVATETLKARVASYGAEDKSVRAWLATQDRVFQNCDATGTIPETLGSEAPEWLRKDRDYQIAAAHFYSLHFEQAQTHFAAIASDPGSPWQETADYLVGRTLVRQASLTENESRRNEIYKQAEVYLQSLQGRSLKFARATRRLLALVKYRLHPEERVGELARVLAYQKGNDSLGQDLIDYVWLVDKFEAATLAEIERRKNPSKEEDGGADSIAREAARLAALNNPQTFEITIYPKLKEGTPDYSERASLELNYSVSQEEILQAFEIKLARKLTPEELSQIKGQHESALAHREYLASPNRKFDRQTFTDHEGCDYGCEHLTIAAIPEVLRADELTDWILTFQTADPRAYGHALAKWRETKSEAWLALMLAKAEKNSPRIAQVMRRAEKVERDSPAYPTVAYHLIRLKASLGQLLQARTLVDDIISWQAEVLPLSAQNQFLEQRMGLAKNLDEFLQFSNRRPVTFYEEGRYGKLSEFFEQAKAEWSAENKWGADYSQQDRADFERTVVQRYQSLLPWDDQTAFDDQTVEVINWHFPLTMMAGAARNHNLPAHMQRRFVLAAWTRAIALKQTAVAQKLAPDVLKMAPEMSTVLQPYLDAQTAQERSNAALYVLLKFPGLSPMLDTGVGTFSTIEETEYYLEIAWWCSPSLTEFTDNGDEVRKVIAKPMFLSPAQSEVARRERVALIAIGDAKSYLGKQVLVWARNAPDDPRVPEALYITVQANWRYKYGCSGWEHDDKTKKQAETLLRTRYPQSAWTAKLATDEQ